MRRFISAYVLCAALTAWGGCSERVVIGELSERDQYVLSTDTNDNNENSDTNGADNDAGPDASWKTLSCMQDSQPFPTSGPILAIWGTISLEFGAWYWDIYAVGGSDDVSGNRPKGLMYQKLDNTNSLVTWDWDNLTYSDFEFQEPIYGVWGTKIDIRPFQSHNVLLVHGAGAHRLRMDRRKREVELIEEVELERIFDENDKPELFAVYGTSLDNIYVVGSQKWPRSKQQWIKEAISGGKIAHYDGERWSQVTVEDPYLAAEIDRAWLTDIWCDSSTGRVYTVSSEATDRKIVEEIEPQESTKTVTSYWVTMPSSQGAIYEYDGSTWRKVFPDRYSNDVRYYFFSVWGRGATEETPGEVFVAGTKRVGEKPPYRSELVVMRKRDDEERWHEDETLPENQILSPDENALITGAGIWGSEYNVYVVGSRVPVEYAVVYPDGGVVHDVEDSGGGLETYTYKGSPRGFMIHNSPEDKWSYIRYNAYRNTDEDTNDGSFPFGLLDIWGQELAGYDSTALFFAGTDRIVPCVDVLIQ